MGGLAGQQPEDILADCRNWGWFAQTVKRSDVAARKATCKDTSTRHTTTKLTLNQLMREPAKGLGFTEVAVTLSKVKAEASLLANYHVQRLIAAGVAVPNLTQNFFYQCCAAVGSADNVLGPNDFQQSVAEYKRLRPDGYVVADTAFLAAGASNNLSRQLYTEFRNHVVENFYNRFKAYVRLIFDVDSSAASSFLKDVYSEQYTGSDEMVQYYRSLLPRSPWKVNLARYPHEFLPFLQQMQEYMELNSHRKGAKPFTLLPVKQGFKCCYFKICSTTLFNLLKVRSCAIVLNFRRRSPVCTHRLVL